MILKIILFFTSIHSLVHDLILVSLTLLLWRRWLLAAGPGMTAQRIICHCAMPGGMSLNWLKGVQGEVEGPPLPLPCSPRALLLC